MSDWLTLQLEAWPTRVDPKKTTNITFLMQEAAQAIRTLTKERDMAVEALRAFVGALDEWGDDKGQPDRWNTWEHPISLGVNLGDFRKARATLAQLEAPKGAG